MIAFGAAIYDWSHKETTAAMTVATIPAGVAWNQWAGKSAGGQDAGTCGSLSTCNNAYTKVVHVFDEDNCWPRSKAIPVLGNAASPDAQMALCANTIKHLLGKKPLGAFVLSPTEQLEYSLLKTPVVTCGNAFINDGEIDASKVQLPFLNVEGGGGTFGFPWTYGEETGMCYTGNPALGDGYKEGGERYGGSVTTEEYGHTIFDIGISQFDPQGWMAVQKAEAAAYGKWLANNADKGGHARDEDWDCHTASTEYFAAGAEMLLYNTRIGPNHKATTRTELRDNDPNLWCLAARYYEINNKFAVCPAGPALEDVEQTVNCKAQLEALGVTTFGPEGTGGAKLGGAKTDSSAIVSSTAMCQNTGTTCAAYVSPPPSPATATPPPPSPQNAPPPASYAVKMAVTIAGDVSTFTPEVLTPIRQKVATEAAVPLDAVEATATAGSVKIDFTVNMQSEAAAGTALTAITAKLADKTIASTFLSTPTNPVTVEAIVAPTKVVLVSPPPPSPSLPPPDSDAGDTGLPLAAIAGAAAGGAVLLCGVVGLVIFVRSRGGNKAVAPSS